MNEREIELLGELLYWALIYDASNPNVGWRAAVEVAQEAARRLTFLVSEVDLDIAIKHALQRTKRG